jgi:hypothetical protein
MESIRRTFLGAIAIVLVVCGAWAAEKNVTFPKTAPTTAAVTAAPAQVLEIAPETRPAVIDSEQRFWLGVRVGAASSALRNQLKLGNTGLVVRDVIAGTPAQAEGVLPDDVWLEASSTGMSRPLHDRSDLLAVVANAGATDVPVHVRFLRAGNEQSMSFTPVLRPVAIYRTTGHGHSRHVHVVDDPLLLDAVRPYVVVVPMAAPAAAPALLPANMTVKVTRTGSEPAQIEVRRDDDHWTISETELDQLPPDVRPYVTRELVTPAGVLRTADPRLVPLR